MTSRSLYNFSESYYLASFGVTDLLFLMFFIQKLIVIQTFILPNQ